MKTYAIVVEVASAQELQGIINSREQKGFFLISCSIDKAGPKILAVLIFNASVTTEPFNYESK